MITHKRKKTISRTTVIVYQNHKTDLGETWKTYMITSIDNFTDLVAFNIL